MLSELQKRCIDLSYKFQLTHVSSTLNAVGSIDAIYGSKKDNDLFVLSNGHTGLALYVVLEKYKKLDAESLYLKHGTHPTRDVNDGIYCSTGSLGMGITVAVGMALADRKRNVYVMTSDGEMMEGSCWEALRIASEQRLENLRVICIANGYSAHRKVDTEVLDTRMQMFYPSLVQYVNVYDKPDWLQGVDGHYVKMDEAKYKEITK